MSNSIGILDPDGVNLNPINNKVYSDKYKELSKKWREFPAYEKAKDVIKMIKDNNVILINCMILLVIENIFIFFVLTDILYNDSSLVNILSYINPPFS